MKRSHHHPGAYIVFEGGDGAGKSTQFERAIQYLGEKKYSVTATREPGGTHIGEQIRLTLLDPANTEMSLPAEYFLYTAARAQLMNQKIKPALAKGNIILSDRADVSTYAYQMCAGGLNKVVSWELFRTMQNIAMEGIRPDMTLIYEVSAATAATRLNLLLDRMEQKGREYHEKVMAAYLDYAKKAEAEGERVRIISAEPNQDEVFEATRKELDEFLRRRAQGNL